MVRKGLIFALTTAALFCLASVVGNNEVSKVGFEESTLDLLNEEKGLKLNDVVGLEETNEIKYSKTYAQYGISSANKYCIRFATAVKGDLNSLSYTRFAVGDRVQEEKKITTVYKGIISGGVPTYYTDDPADEDGLTTVQEESDYYWACFTIVFNDYYEYHDVDFSVQFNINNEITLETKKASLDSLVELSGAKYVNVMEAEDERVSLDWAGATVIDETAKGATSSGGKHLTDLTEGTLIQYYIESASDQEVIIEPSIACKLGIKDYYAFIANTYVNDAKVYPLNDGIIQNAINNTAADGWFNFGTVEIPAVLNKGLNVISFRPTNEGTNFDNITITSKQAVSLVSKPVIEGNEYIFEVDKASLLPGRIGLPTMLEYENTTKFLHDINDNDGASITYKVNASADTTSRVFFSLGAVNNDNGNNDLEDIDFELSVNGTKLDSLKVTSYLDTRNVTTDWRAFYEYEIADIDLKQGENEIEIYIQDKGASFDHMKLVSPVELEVIDNHEQRQVYRIEAESAFLSNGSSSEGVRVETTSKASNGANVGYLNNNYGAALYWGVNVDSEENVSTRFRYAIAFDGESWNPNSGFSLYINGVKQTIVCEYAWQSSYGWTTYHEVELTSFIELNPGLNTIVITIKGNFGNFDYFDIYSDSKIEQVDYKKCRFEAENAIKVNGTQTIKDESYSGASNGVAVGYLNDNKGASLTWNINVKESTTVNFLAKIGLGVYSISNSNYTFKLIKDGETTTISTPDTLYNYTGKSWNDAFTKYVINSHLHLTKGSYSLVLEINGQFGNIDYIELTGFSEITAN